MRALLGQAALFTGLSAAAFGRLLPRLETSLSASDLYDTTNFVWIQWWYSFSLKHGLPLSRTRHLFHPVGADISIEVSLTNYLMNLPLSLALDPVGRYNALMILSYIITGVAAYAFCRLFTESAAGATLGAVFFTFSPFRNAFCLYGALDVVQTQWFLLLLWAALRYYLRGGGPAALLCVPSAAALCAYHEPRLFMMAGLFGGGFAALHAAGLGRRGEDWRPFAARAALIAASAGAVVLPLLMHHLDVYGAAPKWVPRRAELFLASPARLFMFPPHHAVRALRDAAAPFSEGDLGYLNVLAVGLAAFAFGRKADGPRRIMLVLFAAFAAMSFSYWPLSAIPIFSHLKVPARLFILVTLALSVLVACGWEGLARRFSGRRTAGAVYALFAAAFFLETNPLFSRPIDVPRSAALARLREAPGSAAVLEVPFGLAGGLTPHYYPRALLRAAEHEKPVLTGNVALFPAADYTRNAAFRRLTACQEEGDCAGVDEGFFAALGRDLDVGYVLVAATHAENPLALRVAAARNLEPEWADDQVRVYRLRGEK